jgi:hypothetical protein
MSIDAKQWYEDWCERDKQKILATNPTIDQLIRDSQIYRFKDAVFQACRKAGGCRRAKNYQAQDRYLALAIPEIEKSGQPPTLKRLKQWVEIDNPHQEFSETAFRKAIATYRKNLRASKSTDKDT